MIVVPKSELQEGKAAKELRGISAATTQANAEKNGWQAEVVEMLRSLEPFDKASAKIREKLEKPEWPFTLAVIKRGKERRLVLHSEECQDDAASIVLQTDRLRPCVGNMPLLRSVLMEAAERLADRVHEIKKTPEPGITGILLKVPEIHSPKRDRKMHSFGIKGTIQGV